jgi:hypothetical protein
MNVRVGLRDKQGKKFIVEVSNVESLEEARQFAMREMKIKTAVAVQIPEKADE